MKLSRAKVVNLLRETGYTRVADIAEQELPDPVDLDQAMAFGEKHGLTRDDLISHLGGSP